jgi:anti-repressor protein
MIQTNTLIPINYDSDRPTVSARELHQFLEVGTKFQDWFPRMCEYGFSEGVDFNPLKIENVLSQKRERTYSLMDYQLTLDMAKELCMIQRTERGKQARQYFIEIEKRWNDPETLMARALKMADEKIGRLESRIESEKPKVLFADSVCASKNSILVGEMAKLLKQNGIDIGEKRFFRWLRENGYLIARYGTDYNMPTQKSMELKIFEIKETSITHSSGTVTVSKTPKLTGKGQQYFINKFLGKEANNS